MTDKTRRHFKRGWDLSKVPVILGSFLLLAQQLVALRGDLLKQQESKAVMAQTIVSQGRDISRLSIENAALKIRVSRLERLPRLARAAPLHGTAEADTVADRSPGIVTAAVDLVVAPFRLLGAVFRGR